MKKAFSLILALVAVFCMAIPSFAAETTNVNIDGYTVTAPAGVKVTYADANGNVTANPEDAAEVQLRAAGDIIINGELYPAGANGKTNVQLNLPIYAPVEAPTEESEEIEVVEEVSVQETNIEVIGLKKITEAEVEEPILEVNEELVGAPDIAVNVTANFFTALWGRICAYISSIFTFFQLF